MPNKNDAIYNSRKPGLPRLTKSSLEDAPEEAWVGSVSSAVNQIADSVDLIRSNSAGIKLLQNADVEMHEIVVQVPDPWKVVTSFTNGWAQNNETAYYKGYDGVVEVIVSVIGGTPAASAFTLPKGYRPRRVIDGPSYDTALAGADRFTIGTDGTVIPGYMVGGDEPMFQIRFLSADPTPVPLSCWPNMIETKLQNVAGVVVCDVRDESTSEKLPASVGAPVWEITTIAGKKNVKLLNIPWLPYNRKYRIKLLFIGG